MMTYICPDTIKALKDAADFFNMENPSYFASVIVPKSNPEAYYIKVRTLGLGNFYHVEVPRRGFEAIRDKQLLKTTFIDFLRERGENLIDAAMNAAGEDSETI